MPILVVKERDLQDTQGDGANTGFWHFYNFDGISLTHIKSVYHNNNNNRNDSGQSCYIGNTEYQVNCICTLGSDNVNLTTWNGTKVFQGTDVMNKALIREYEIRYSGDIVRMLGITAYGNGFIIGGMDHPSYNVEGLWYLHCATWQEGAIAPMTDPAENWVPSGITRRGNLIYSVCQDDHLLRVYKIGSINWGGYWEKVGEYTISGGGDKNFRGCAFYGDFLLVGNEEYDKIQMLKIGASALTQVAEFDISSDKHDPDNLMPYGLFFYMDAA